MRIIKLSIVIALFLSACNSEKSTKEVNDTSNRIYLFNGTDFVGWDFFLKDSTIAPQDVWSIKDSVIHCKGEPFGYMRTKDEYENYQLHVEWRWIGEPTNSGVFLHLTGENKIWPNTIEAQLCAGNAGDFICIGETNMKERLNKEEMVVKKRDKSFEKQSGEWNTYDITCKDNTITLLINDVFMNSATETNVNKGCIALQSEGGPIEFRNAYLTILK